MRKMSKPCWNIEQGRKRNFFKYSEMNGPTISLFDYTNFILLLFYLTLASPLIFESFSENLEQYVLLELFGKIIQ